MKLLISFCVVFILLGIEVGHDSFVKKVFAQADAPLNINPYTPNKTTTGVGALPKSATSSWCTKVGNASGPNPCPPIAQVAGKLPPGTSASCPILGGKIGCGSYGPPISSGGFYGSCAVDSTGNGGHCNAKYRSPVSEGGVGICSRYQDNGNLIRTAKSIDVSNNSRPGDPVYLPTIRGQSLKWFYRGVVSAGGGFGWMRLFQSEPTPEGNYTLHFVHVNDSPPLTINQQLNSGDVGATLFEMGDGYIHVHVTVGLNIKEPITDNNLQEYDPGWLFADRDLAMCTGG